MRKQTNGESQSEAHTFAELTRKLLAVPKKEVDAEKAKYKRKKEQAKENRGK